MVLELTEEQRAILTTIREFVQREVVPVASRLDESDEYPGEIVEAMKGMGLFGAIVPREHGGLGLSYTTYALIIEELAKGWMSLTGVLNSHLIMAYIVASFGTQEEKERFLPFMASGEKRGGIAITEPNAGSDVQGIETYAQRRGDLYILNGTKTLITNSRYGNTFAVLAKTDREAKPPYRGISCFIVEKGDGWTVTRDIPKLGYRGVDTCEMVFQDVAVPATNLVGGEEGRGFIQMMSGLEVGRINVAARAVGVARAALEAALGYSQQRYTFGQPISQHQAIQMKLADMVTQVQAAHLLVLHAAAKKDQGRRCDLEAGMAKLFASEVCLQVATEAMRIHGGYGYTKDLPLERYYREAPLMIIGEGTNEIQKLVIARNLFRRQASGELEDLL